MVWLYVRESIFCIILLTNRSVFSPCHIFVPPYPIKKFFYRCDKKFYLEDLLKLYDTVDNYAIVLVSGKRTDFYIHNKNTTKLLKSVTESLPNQHRTGGQSAQRFERIRDERIGWYVKKLLEMMIQYYTKEGVFVFKGLIIAGPAEIKSMLKDHDIFTQYFAKYLLKTVAISEINENSIYHVVKLADDVLDNNSESYQKLKNIDTLVSNDNTMDLVVFGNDNVMLELEAGSLREIYVDAEYINNLDIDNINKKTSIHIIDIPEFKTKYGEMVGVRYYVIPTNTISDADIIEI